MVSIGAVGIRWYQTCSFPSWVSGVCSSSVEPWRGLVPREAGHGEAGGSSTGGGLGAERGTKDIHLKPSIEKNGREDGLCTHIFFQLNPTPASQDKDFPSISSSSFKYANIIIEYFGGDIYFAIIVLKWLILISVGRNEIKTEGTLSNSIYNHVGLL